MGESGASVEGLQRGALQHEGYDRKKQWLVGHPGSEQLAYPTFARYAESDIQKPRVIDAVAAFDCFR